jgi:predicted O-methyltransferase YrrM
MTDDAWTTVDHYLSDTLIGDDPVCADVLEANAAAGLPAIDVSATQGKFLMLLARIAGARTILEIGTLGGFSTIWLARGLPDDGTVVTLEVEPGHAEVALRNIDAAGLHQDVDLILGMAVESLATLGDHPAAPFDLVFIDADKRSNPDYLEAAVRLSRPGTVIVCDNVIRDGQIVDPDSTDPSVIGTRQFFERLHDHPRLDATALQTVGSKGWDGFAIAVVR